MSMTLKVIFIITTVAIRDISCAPKIGPLIFDPLIYESENSLKTEESPIADLSDDWLTAPVLRSNGSNDNSKKKPCQSYDYDVTQCKYVNDRMICGYNKNIGDPVSDENKDVGNGCRIRNDRMECGYIIGPFVVPRRPPANVNEIKQAPKENLRSVSFKSTTLETSTTTRKKNTDTIIIEDPVVLDNADDIEIRTKRNLRNDSLTTLVTNTIQRSSTTTSDYGTYTDTKENEQPKKYCVEKNDRIFCYTAT